MFGWFKRKEETADRGKAAALYEAVRTALGEDPQKDDEHVRIVASVAAVLLCVAYADLDYSADEEEVLRATLSRVNGLDAAGVGAILRVLREHTVMIASVESTTYARELLELTAEDFRLELLDVLVDLAAADEHITVAETNMMRSVVRALGLSQAQYNASQARHRDKLSVLKD
jgi:uncharacterized tellurite resistance protein B-like protein